MSERESSPTQRTYGRGLVEGLKLAGVENPGDVMNNVRLKSMEEGLNGAARKVYDMIPITGVISIPDIIRSARERGQTIEHSIVKGVIANLLDKGLIRSVSDKYQRIAPKPVVVRDNTEKPMNPPATQEREPERPCDPIGRMALIEAQLKEVAQTLQKIAKDVADTALDVEAFVERIRTDNAKVSQLKELLKSL